MTQENGGVWSMWMTESKILAHAANTIILGLRLWNFCTENYYLRTLVWMDDQWGFWNLNFRKEDWFDVAC